MRPFLAWWMRPPAHFPIQFGMCGLRYRPGYEPVTEGDHARRNPHNGCSLRWRTPRFRATKWPSVNPWVPGSSPGRGAPNEALSLDGAFFVAQPLEIERTT